jgi:hypothetical protein
MRSSKLRTDAVVVPSRRCGGCCSCAVLRLLLAILMHRFSLWITCFLIFCFVFLLLSPPLLRYLFPSISPSFFIAERCSLGTFRDAAATHPLVLVCYDVQMQLPPKNLSDDGRIMTLPHCACLSFTCGYWPPSLPPPHTNPCSDSFPPSSIFPLRLLFGCALPSACACTFHDQVGKIVFATPYSHLT